MESLEMRLVCPVHGEVRGEHAPGPDGWVYPDGIFGCHGPDGWDRCGSECKWEPLAEPVVVGPWLVFVDGEATNLRSVYDERIIREGGELRLEPKEGVT